MVSADSRSSASDTPPPKVFHVLLWEKREMSGC